MSWNGVTTSLKLVYYPNFFIEDHYKKLPELFQELRNAVQEASFQEVPSIAYWLQFELYYKDDIYKIWDLIEEKAL